MRNVCWGCLVCLLLLATAAFAEVPLPEALKEFPVYEGGVVAQSMNTGQGVFAMIELPESAETEAVLGFFKDYFQGKGWTLSLELRDKQGGALSYAKDGRQVMLTVDVSAEPAGYTIVLTQEQ